MEYYWFNRTYPTRPTTSHLHQIDHKHTPSCSASNHRMHPRSTASACKIVKNSSYWKWQIQQPKIKATLSSVSSHSIGKNIIFSSNKLHVSDQNAALSLSWIQTQLLPGNIQIKYKLCSTLLLMNELTMCNFPQLTQIYFMPVQIANLMCLLHMHTLHNKGQ